MVEGTIPSEIGLCNQLSSLMIEGPRLYGTVPTEILSVLPLRYLSLGGPLNGTLLPTTNTTIANPTFFFPSSLERINIEDTKLTGEIPWDSLGALTNMKSFRWTDNTRIESVLPSTVGLLTSLAELVVAGSRGVTGSLPTEIGALTGLQQLILQDTKLEGNLPTELAQCTALQVIDVSNTLMEGTIWPELCPLLQSDLAFSFNDCGSHVICLSTENCE
eukprot:CAMPEP_0202449648 /NCGR_PEP_ID=MMETSP1360-20130828/8356_1 /ASSEMBLY_ACC=CAM_ASM_000848 /TAXON_ID=515479 /ORGANISM="Licmophora paradoxa, Strain CCMP2313" /LENGTH=217 /DNA_ID=CAMNT_0049067625 /DNA_START=120 /DNA_END=773 /DNA_ORIENTATION=+